MTLSYSVVARGPVTLVETNKSPSLNEAELKAMLANIPLQSNAKTTYTTDQYAYHVVVNDGLIYLCIADATFDKTQAYNFLDTVLSEFKSRADLYSRAKSATALDFQSSFGPTLISTMDSYRAGGSAENGSVAGRENHKVNQLRSQVDEVKNIMTENVEKVLQRGERLEDLMDKSTDLEANAVQFRTTSRRMRVHFCRQNLKCTLILIGTGLLVLFLIIMISLYETGAIGHKHGGSNSGSVTSKP